MVCNLGAATDIEGQTPPLTIITQTRTDVEARQYHPDAGNHEPSYSVPGTNYQMSEVVLCKEQTAALYPTCDAVPPGESQVTSGERMVPTDFPVTSSSAMEPTMATGLNHVQLGGVSSYGGGYENPNERQYARPPNHYDNVLRGVDLIFSGNMRVRSDQPLQAMYLADISSNDDPLTGSNLIHYATVEGHQTLKLPGPGRYAIYKVGSRKRLTSSVPHGGMSSCNVTAQGRGQTLARRSTSTNEDLASRPSTSRYQSALDAGTSDTLGRLEESTTRTANRSRRSRKPKLYEQPPQDDPEKEAKRQGAVKAYNRREKKKAEDERKDRKIQQQQSTIRELQQALQRQADPQKLHNWSQ